MTTPNDPTRAPTRPLTREDLDAIPPSSPVMPAVDGSTERWFTRCSACDALFPAEEEVQDDVCPRCGRRGCLGAWGAFSSRGAQHLAQTAPEPSPPIPDPRLQAALTRAIVAEGQAKELREEVARLKAASEEWTECASGHDPCLFRPADGCPACWALVELHRARKRAEWRTL